MKVSPREIADLWSDGTGRQPEAVLLVAMRAVAVEVVVAALHAADLASRYRTPPLTGEGRSR